MCSLSQFLSFAPSRLPVLSNLALHLFHNSVIMQKKASGQILAIRRYYGTSLCYPSATLTTVTTLTFPQVFPSSIALRGANFTIHHSSDKLSNQNFSIFHNVSELSNKAQYVLFLATRESQFPDDYRLSILNYKKF